MQKTVFWLAIALVAMSLANIVLLLKIWAGNP